MQQPDRHDWPHAEEALGPDELRAADVVHAACDPEGFAVEFESRDGEGSLDAFLASPEVQGELSQVRAFVETARA